MAPAAVSAEFGLDETAYFTEATSCKVWGVSREASVSDPTTEVVSKNRNIILFLFLSL
jgi:hypothetical protein